MKLSFKYGLIKPFQQFLKVSGRGVVLFFLLSGSVQATDVTSISIPLPNTLLEAIAACDALVAGRYIAAGHCTSDNNMNVIMHEYALGPEAQAQLGFAIGYSNIILLPPSPQFTFIATREFPYTMGPCPAGRVQFGNQCIGCPDDTTLVSHNGLQLCLAEEPVMAKNPASCPIPGGAPIAEGNPINIATGNKYQLETDFSGSSDFALSFSRHYNSLKPFDSTINQQWRHNYERSLEVNLTSSPTFIRVNRHDGVAYFFSPLNIAGTFGSDTDVVETLEQTSTGFRFITANNIIEDYDNTGRLLSMTNTRNQTITLSYNTVTDLLDTVTDHFGRSLSFDYDINGRLVSFDDPDGNTYRYEYDAVGKLDKVIYPDETPNDLSDNPQRLYLYENTNFPSHLTAIIDETGARFASWDYDVQGRGIFSEHNNGTERVDIVYNVDGTTTVTDQIGAVRTYTFDVMFGVAKTVNIEGDQCTTCGSDAQAITYDPNGFVASRTDFNGNTTDFTRDNRGLALSRTEAVGTPVQRTITTTWHPNFRLPLEVVEPNKTTTFTYDTNGNLISRVETNIGVTP